MGGGGGACQPRPAPVAGGGGNLLPVPMTSRPRVFVGLGANVGDREENLRRARRGLEARGLRITALSSLYHTEPVDAPPQEWFDRSQVVLHERSLGR